MKVEYKCAKCGENVAHEEVEKVTTYFGGIAYWTCRHKGECQGEISAILEKEQSE